MERIIKHYLFHLIFLLFLMASAGINWYAGRWIASSFHLNRLIRLLPLLFVAAGLLAFGTMRLRHFAAFPGSAALSFIGFSWMGGILIAATSFAFCSLIFFILRKCSVIVPQHMQAWITVVFAALCLASSFYNGFCQPKIRNIELRSDKLPQALDGYRIVQLSDLHLDSKVKMDSFRRTMERINKLNPNMVLITGDVIDPGVDLSDASKGYFNALKAKDGVYACLGNHEYYFGLEESIELFSRFGLKLLHNDSIETAGLRLTGIGDIKSERLDAGAAASYAGRNPSMPEIVLSHEPLYYKEFAEKGTMLVLSGHTHRGQIFPFHLFVRIVYPFFYGHYAIDGTHFYVTSGTGSWGPRMRFLAAPEIPLITLRAIPAEK